MVLADSWPQPDWPPGSVQVWVKNVTLAFLKLFHCVAWTLSFKDTTACSSIDQSRHSWAEEATLSRGGWVIRFYHSCYWLFIWASLTGTMKLLLLDRTSREIWRSITWFWHQSLSGQSKCWTSARVSICVGTNIVPRDTLACRPANPEIKLLTWHLLDDQCLRFSILWMLGGKKH